MRICPGVGLVNITCTKETVCYDRDGADWISAASAALGAVEHHEATVQLLQKVESSEEHSWLPHPLAVGQPAPDKSRRGFYERSERIRV